MSTSFNTWLQLQTSRRDLTGKFASAFLSLPKPSGRKAELESLSDVLAYLEKLGAGDSAFVAARIVWAEYAAEIAVTS